MGRYVQIFERERYGDCHSQKQHTRREGPACPSVYLQVWRRIKKRGCRIKTAKKNEPSSPKGLLGSRFHGII